MEMPRVEVTSGAIRVVVAVAATAAVLVAGTGSAATAVAAAVTPSPAAAVVVARTETDIVQYFHDHPKHLGMWLLVKGTTDARISTFAGVLGCGESAV